MSDLRFEQQREHFEAALARLREALLADESDIVRDALIKRFEFTFEMAWRTLFRFLVGKGERVAQQTWAVLPLAFQSLLIEDAELWDQIRKYRNLTSHTYDQAKAVEVAAFVRSTAVGAFESLLARLRTL